MKSLTVLILLSFFFPETYAQDSLYLVDTITGESYQKRITNVDRVGDVNGDGYADFMVSSRTGNIRRDQGIAQLYLGSSNLNLTPDVTFHYPCCDTVNNLGFASEIGDVNNDGYDDFTISSKFADAGFNKGKVFLYYGGETIDTIPVAEFYDPWIQDYFGDDVEAVGDLNKDGYDDFTIGSKYNWTNGLGYLYLFWGGDTISWKKNLTFTSGASEDFFGTSAANVGDVNNDGFEDLAIGAPNTLSTNQPGVVYIYFGGANMDNEPDTFLFKYLSFGKNIKNLGNFDGNKVIDFCISSLDTIFVYSDITNQPTKIAAYSVDSGGDINGDGLNDFITGNDRKINVFFGNENSDLTSDIILDDSLRYSTAFIYIVGDLNNDGYDELISFAPNYPNFDNRTGKMYIYSYINLTNVNENNEYIITDFALLQNYPNPFNPSTNIQYAISSRQFVTLKVYDVLGKEIATLVNEEKSAGSYEVEFNSVETLHATSLPSGVYFYQLRAGAYIETKKMILLK